jgi:NADP-reducing hydrogenase subunit HndD
METVKLTIDNKEVEAKKGSTIYQAAKLLGIDIPALCYMELQDMNIENKPGGCRICVVEVEGRRNLAPACSTKCESGMVVKTHTIRVLNARRTVMEFLLSDPERLFDLSKIRTLRIAELGGKIRYQRDTFRR